MSDQTDYDSEHSNSSEVTPSPRLRRKSEETSVKQKKSKKPKASSGKASLLDGIGKELEKAKLEIEELERDLNQEYPVLVSSGSSQRRTKNFTPEGNQ